MMTHMDDDQNQAFIDWVNFHLDQVDIRISSLETGFNDGLNLVYLVQVLSGDKLRYVKNPRHYGQKLDNTRVAISHIEEKWGIKVLGCDPIGILEGNRKQCMGLLFLLINSIRYSQPTEEKIVNQVKKRKISEKGYLIRHRSKAFRQRRRSLEISKDDSEDLDEYISKLGYNDTMETIQEDDDEVPMGNDDITESEADKQSNVVEDVLDGIDDYSSDHSADILTTEMEPQSEEISVVPTIVEHLDSEEAPQKRKTEITPYVIEQYFFDKSWDSHVEEMIEEDSPSYSMSKSISFPNLDMTETEESMDSSDFESSEDMELVLQDTSSDSLNIEIETIQVPEEENQEMDVGSETDELKYSFDKKEEKRIIGIQAIMRMQLTLFHPTKQWKRFNKRKGVATEILNSELAYVDGLSCLKEVYFSKLATVSEDMFPKKMISTITSNLTIIHSFNSAFYKELSKRMENFYQHEERIGDIFCKYSKMFKIYTDYVKQYRNTIIGISERAYDLSLQQLLQTCRMDPRCNHRSIEDLLITPVQRIPRYQLLLQELIDNTPSHHSDLPDLKKALVEIVSVAVYVNEKKKEAENLHSVCVIANQISGYDRILPDGGRQYVRQGMLFEAEFEDEMDLKKLVKNAQWRQRYVFQFSDILVITKAKNSGIFSKSSSGEVDHYRFQKELSLSDYSIVHVEPSKNHFIFGLERVSDKCITSLFYTSSEYEKEEWVQDLDDAMSLLLKNSVSLSGLGDIPLIHVPHNDQVIKKGSMNYKGSNLEWKERYFTLSKYFFSLYLDEESFTSGSEPIKRFNLLKLSISRWPVSDRPFCIEIKTPEVFLYLNAESNSERMSWINGIRFSIRDLVQYLKENDLPSPKRVQRTLSRRRSKSVKGNGDRTLRGYRKTGVVMRLISEEKVREEKMVLRENLITFYKDKRKKCILDLRYASSKISPKSIEKTKIDNQKYFFFVIATKEEEVEIGIPEISEVEDWITRINKTIKRLRRKSVNY
eukprot:TRINITY_DN3245_c0_g1_i2.p1 TRINITY_DN3245_c0_g1~~TRINITY_DN3245_c0_g1_i2.p1  ORF type:complete len:995 (+),score=239.26 TRINITY_DN3245_c0_g1_i2:257-3241(+)